jgi:two-component system response regulator RegA
MGESERVVRSVLVVDDDARVLAAFTRMLLRRGCRVSSASEAGAARRLANAQQPDLAIVDLRLGATSGIDLIRDLKSDHPTILTALISGYLSVPITVSAVHAGADLVLFKPVTCEEILAHVEQGTSPRPDLRETPSLARVEWEHIARVVADCQGNISMAARQLGILRQSLQRRLRKQPPRS